MECDVLMVNAIGPAFTGDSVRREGIGGSELEVTQIAEALAARGHSVVVANGVAAPSQDHGVTYIPFRTCGGTKCHALYIERGTTLAHIKEAIHANRIVVRATDIMCEHYEPHREMLATGDVGLVGVSEWQLDGFRAAIPGIEAICIPPMLGPTPPTEKVPGRFIFASAPCKGREATIAKWVDMWTRYPEMRKCHLVLVSPGYASGEAYALTPQMQSCGIEDLGTPTIEEYRRLIASAEAVFYVNAMAETYCNVAALAERSGTRLHMLCLDGIGGVREASRTGCITDHDGLFEAHVRAAMGRTVDVSEAPDRSPEALVGRWEEALQLVEVEPPESYRPTPEETAELECRTDYTETGPAFHATTAKGANGPSGPTPEAFPLALGMSDESQMPQEPPLNPEPVPEFGPFLSLMRSSVGVGGSELGLGVSLFSLAVSIRAACVVEIGRFKGFSTLALAGALKFCDIGWQEPKGAEQRPDIDYAKHHAKKKRQLVSIDKHPEQAARDLITKAGLDEHVMFVDQASQDVTLKGDPIDLLFIDGDHTYEGCKRDVARFVPQVRPGGYVVLHDYFGWYDAAGRNGSAIKRVCDELVGLGVEHLLVDTGYASFMVFRKRDIRGARSPKPVPPREDGKPTVGLALLAKNENPIVARAVQSCAAWIDCVTVLVDAESNDGTAELCERLGAEVHVRPYAGSLAETRNELLAIAEQRTDYMLIVDADDLIEGTRPIALTADIYDLMIHDGGGISYPRGQLIKSRIGARYVGCDKGCKGNIPHEYLDRPGASYGGICASLIYRRLGGIKGVSGWQDQAGSKAKYLRHARDLERHLLEHPDHLRTLFYLGQSYRDAAEPRKAIEWYQRRADAFADEEGWYSQYRIGELQMELGEDPTAAWLKAYEMRRVRAESLVALAVYCRDEKVRRFEQAYLYAKQAATLPMPEERLFMHPDVYRWVARWEHGLAAHFTGRHDEAVGIWQGLVAAVPGEHQQQARGILDACIKARDASRRAA